MSTPNPPDHPGGQPPEGWQPYGYGPQQGPQFPPPYGYGPQQGPQFPPPSGYPLPPGYPPPQPYPGHQPYPGYAVGPYAPFGHDPISGLPLSDKSATTAGVLQLFFGCFGIGRFYIDSTQIAIAQLCLGLFGLVFGVLCFVGFPVLIGSVVWAVVDAIMMFTGSVPDGNGRKLR